MLLCSNCQNEAREKASISTDLRPRIAPLSTNRRYTRLPEHISHNLASLSHDSYYPAPVQVPEPPFIFSYLQFRQNIAREQNLLFPNFAFQP